MSAPGSRRPAASALLATVTFAVIALGAAGPASATTYIPRAPVVTDLPGTANDTYTIFSSPGVDWYVNGVLVDPAKLDVPQPLGGVSSLRIVATPRPGYAFPEGSITVWTLYVESPPPPLEPVTVTSEVIAAAQLPTVRVSWSAPGATTYDVSYHKVLANGTAGPELPWFTGTTRTTADFILDRSGGRYVVTVVAYDAAGSASAPASTTIDVIFDPAPSTDISVGIGTFNAGWQHLTNLMAMQNLPYAYDTAALGFRGATWTVTLPAGTTTFELLASVFDLGARGTILVNGRTWADFETNARYWGAVSDPYAYPVRTIRGWDSSKPVTITVMATDAGVRYLVLDAFRAY